MEAFEVVLDAPAVIDLSVQERKEVHLVNPFKALAGWGMSAPGTEVSARTAQPGDDGLAVSDQLDDVHRDIGKRLQKWPDPVTGFCSGLRGIKLVKRCEVAATDCLNQHGNNAFVVLGRLAHGSTIGPHLMLLQSRTAHSFRPGTQSEWTFECT
jgi:hypothetical protein